MTTRQERFITSVEVRPGGGAHDYVTIWIRHQSVGTLCVGKGDGEELRTLLLRQEEDLTPWMRGAIGAMRTAADEQSPSGGPLPDPRRPREWPLSAGLSARLSNEPWPPVPFVMEGPLRGAPRLRQPGPWSTHDHTTAEAGPGAPAPSREDASKAEVESRPLGVPPAAGAPPTFDEDAWRDEETQQS